MQEKNFDFKQIFQAFLSELQIKNLKAHIVQKVLKCRKIEKFENSRKSNSKRKLFTK